MPKARFYLTLRRGSVQIRSHHTGEIAFSYASTAIGIARATRKCLAMNNSIESDTTTFNIADHLKKIGKERDIPADFLPTSEPVAIEWRV